MFEALYPRRPDVVQRHVSAPWYEERARYLAHLKSVGYKAATLIETAEHLLWAVRLLRLRSSRRVTLDEVRSAAKRRLRYRGSPRISRRRKTYAAFLHVVSAWLRYVGRLDEPAAMPPMFQPMIDDFSRWALNERGHVPATVEYRSGIVRSLLAWLTRRQRRVSSIRPTDVDAFLMQQGHTRWRRTTVHSAAHALRAFFRYGATRGWCPATLAESVMAPRVFADEDVPVGPTWDEVRRMIDRVNTDHPNDIRDRAILLLLAIYGLRAGEVAAIRLDDIDWVREQLHVTRSKSRTTDVYPFIPAMGDSLVRYLKTVRPPCAFREVFITAKAPLKPLSRTCISTLTHKQFVALGIQSPRRGSHALRHACASHLLQEGFTLKEIGDHLGHRSTAATRIYAKVDLARLRDVASVDLRGLL